MDDKKTNNAIEKTEALARSAADDGANNSRSNDSRKNAKAKKSAVKGKTDKSGSKKAMLAAKQKKEEEKAKARMQKAELAAAKKEERKRLKEERRLAAIEKREKLKELRLKKKEERLARRDALRHETKEARAERLFAEKQAKIELKRERRERRAMAAAEKRKLKEQRIAEKNKLKAEEKERRSAERSARRASRTSRGLGGWLAAVIALGCSTLVLATLLVWNAYMTGNGGDMLAGTYARAFYDLVGYVDNIDVNLGKLGVSSDNGNRQKILSDIVVQASLAEGDIEDLPLEDESRFYTVKFVNQLYDFGKYLNNKLIDGETLSESDLNVIASFKKINQTLKEELNELAGNLGDGFDFNTLLTGDAENVVLKKFNELQANAVEYPKMIYDGPFADEPEKTAGNVKSGGKRIDENDAVDLFKTYLSDYSVEDAFLVGGVDGDFLKAYQISGKAGGEVIDGQLAFDGKLVTFNWYKNCHDHNYDRDACVEIAYSFLEKCGYKSIKAVWVNENEGTVYVNFVHRTDDDIIVYADMIKVEVCTERGMVSAMDASKYIENHKDRDIRTPSIDVMQAEKKLSKDVEVESSRLAFIPLQNGKERLAYEFFGKATDGDYYVYIDAETGRELQIFKVVNTDEGTLLL